MKRIYKGTDCKKEYYKILDNKCFLIREKDGIKIAIFFIGENSIVLFTHFTNGIEVESEVHEQRYTKNLYFENDYVMDVIKSIWVDDNGEIVASDVSRVLPITMEKYEAIRSFIHIQKYKLKNFKDYFNNQLKDLKEHLNIY